MSSRYRVTGSRWSPTGSYYLLTGSLLAIRSPCYWVAASFPHPPSPNPLDLGRVTEGRVRLDSIRFGAVWLIRCIILHIRGYTKGF